MNSKHFRQATLVLGSLSAMFLAGVTHAHADETTTTYYVAEGDSLTSIANATGQTLSQLAADNNLTTTSQLQVGQKLIIAKKANQDSSVKTESQSSSASSSSSSSASANSDKTTAPDTEAQTALTALGNQMGRTLYNGQCYGLTAWYVDQLHGPAMMGSGHEFAQNIGDDYDWSAYGWKVTNYPTPDQIKPGDVICWEAGGALSPGIYGHTGIVKDVDANGNLTTYEQNAEGGQVVQEYHRTFNQTRIKSVIHKVGKQSTTKVSKVTSSSTSTSTKTEKVKATSNSTQTSKANATNHTTLSAADTQAKEWMAQQLSGGSYGTANGQYYGRYQLNRTYLGDDLSAQHQEKVADQYVLGHYGSWTAAKNFWQLNGWY